MDVVHYGLGRVSAPVAGDVSSSDASRSTAEVSELEVKYRCMTAHLSSLTLECGIWCSSSQERGDDIISLRALLENSKHEYKLIGGQIKVLQKLSGSLFFERDECNAKVGRL